MPSEYEKAMVAYDQIKSITPHDGLLLFLVGDFYELHGEDARVAARILGLTLTDNKVRKNLKTVGFMQQHLDAYAEKLIDAGYSVIVSEYTPD